MSSPSDKPSDPQTASSPGRQKASGGGSGKCDEQCHDAPCDPESCKCEASCKCKRNEQSSNRGKPADCKSSNRGDCSNGVSKLAEPADPTDVGPGNPEASGKCKASGGCCQGPCCQGPSDKGPCKDSESKTDCESKMLAKPADPIDGGRGNPEASGKCKASGGSCQGPCCQSPSDKGSCKEGENKTDCESKCQEKEECNSGTGDDFKKETSIVVWHPNQGSPGQSAGSQLAEQKCETDSHKEEEKGCSRTECSPLPPLPQADKLKAVLFDIDGTIADSDPIHFLAFQEVLAEAGYNGGVPISHEFFIRQMSGKLNYVIAEELMPDMEEQKRYEMMDEKEVRYRKLAAKDLLPIPGFHQFAEYVKKRGLRRAAVTNSPRLNAEQVISALKIPDFFDIVVVGSECDNPKPSPDPYLKAINFLGVDPKQCFVLEDSPSGVKAGRAAGAPVVGLLTGHPGPVLRDNGASYLIQDYHDSALWTALGEEPCAGNFCSKGHDSTPATDVEAPTVPVAA